MTVYFIVGLIASAVLFFTLFVCFLRRLQVNWSQRNRSGFSFLLPILLSFLASYVLLFDFGPKVLDVFEIMRNNPDSLTVRGAELLQRGRNIYYGGKKYILPPDRTELFADQSYRLIVSPHARIVLKLELVKEITAEEKAKEEAAHEIGK